MSAPFTVQTITNAGNSISASAWASSGVITITSVQFGSGFPGGSDNVPAYTALKTPICNGQITGENVLVAGQCTIRVNLAGTSIPSTFQINELGVFASFAGGGSQLVAYMSSGSAVGDTLTVGSPVVKDYAILVTFSQGVITTVNISLLQTVGLHAPTHLDNGIDPIPPPSTARSGLLLANPNNASMGLIGTNPPSWSPIQRVILTNLTLYVAVAGNNATAIFNDPTHPFSSIQGAVNSLSQYAISATVSITISVGPGTYSGAAATAVISHPNSRQIFISGTFNPDFTYTIGSISGSSFNWNVQLISVSTTAGMAVGSFVILSNPPGISNVAETVISGMFQIIGISGNTVTISVPYYGTTFPSLAGFTSGTGTCLTTYLGVPKNNIGINMTNGIGELEYIGAYPVALSDNNFSCAGFVLSGNGSINRCGAYDFRTTGALNLGCQGFSIDNGATNMLSCCATLCILGCAVVGQGSIDCSVCAFSHNIAAGLYIIGSGSATSVNSCFAGGNSGSGIMVSLGSTLVCQSGQSGGTLSNGSWYVSYNGSNGVVLNSLCTTASSNSSCVIAVNSNIGFDVVVSGMSISQAVIIGSRIFNQAENILTINGSISN